MERARRDGGEVTPLRMETHTNERLTHMLEPAIESHTADTTGARGKRSPDQALQPVNLPDLLLVERARSKDARALETLMRRYNRRLFRIARSIVPDEDEAERVVQEVFRTVFVLRVIEGISGTETAACLGINETTVRTRLYRAQRRLRASMGGVPIERGAIFELPDSRSERIVNAVFAHLNGTLSP